jgi:Fe2+ or Zn2+ uptake regulation protein
MFFIWGVRRYVQQLAVLVARCSLQGHNAAHRLVKRRTKFTFFFIPLFTMNTKHLLACTMCGHTVELPAAQVEGVLAEARRQEQERAGQQYAEFQAPQTEPQSPN